MLASLRIDVGNNPDGIQRRAEKMPRTKNFPPAGSYKILDHVTDEIELEEAKREESGKIKGKKQRREPHELKSPEQNYRKKKPHPQG